MKKLSYSYSNGNGDVINCTTKLRLVEKKDAEFLNMLRSNGEINTYLNPVSGRKSDQEEFIASSTRRNEIGLEYYFIAENDGEPFGTVRIYNVVKGHFEWGSFIAGPGKPIMGAYEMALISFGFAFMVKSLVTAKIRVNKCNEHAIAFYKRFGMSEKENIKSDDLEFRYTSNQFKKTYPQLKVIEQDRHC